MLAGNDIYEAIFRTPLIGIEIVSGNDSLLSMQERIDDCLGFGVPLDEVFAEIDAD